MARTTRSNRIFSPYTAEDAPSDLEPPEILVVNGAGFTQLMTNAFERADAVEAAREYCTTEAGQLRGNPSPLTHSKRVRSHPSRVRNGPDARARNVSTAHPVEVHAEGPASPSSSAAPSQPDAQASTPPDRAHRHQTTKRRRTRAKAQLASQARIVDLKMRGTIVARHSTPAKLTTRMSVNKLPHTAGGWVGKVVPTAKAPLSLDDPSIRSYGLYKWDGCKHVVIVDEDDNVLAALSGRPARDPTWVDSCVSTYQAMKIAFGKLKLRAGDLVHRRGNYAAARIGIGYGGGQTRPMNVDLHGNDEVLEELAHGPGVMRTSGFANGSFAVDSPKLYKACEGNTRQILDHDPSLVMPFSNNIHTGATFNFGPHTATMRHCDSSNLPNGWCSLLSLGDFDHTKGGHVILYPFKLIIQFPANSIMHIPSGSVEHGNIGVQPNETRMSITWYTAGALFRYVAYGFRTEKALAAEDPTAKSRFDDARAGRWQAALRLFSKCSELAQDIRNAFGLST